MGRKPPVKHLHPMARRTRGGERHAGGNNMKAFAKVAALLGCAMLVAGALAACDQELRDKDDRLSTT